MTRTAMLLAVVLAAAACGDGHPAAPSKDAAANSPAAAAAAKTVYGHVVADASQVTLKDLLARPAEFDGKVVRVEGTVDDVCAKRGCWLDVAESDGPRQVRVKVTDGEIVFPMSAKGGAVVAYGTVRVTPLDLEQTKKRAERHAKERGESFDPASVTAPEIGRAHV